MDTTPGEFSGSFRRTPFSTSEQEDNTKPPDSSTVNYQFQSSAVEEPPHVEAIVGERFNPPPKVSGTNSVRHNPVAIWLRTQLHTFDISLLLLSIKYMVSLVLILIGRGSIPLVIFFAMYQATPVARHFGTQMYLVAIVTTLSFAMDPRAKFLRRIFVSLLMYCLATAVTCLGLWSARQAKFHTQSLDDPNIYNSSAAAVSGIFMFFNLFAINAFRAVYFLLLNN